jgi:hypothetical protein
MNAASRRLLFWTPRVICIAFAIFLSLFAMDVFSEHYGFWKTILALLIHLIPVYLVLAVLIVAWRWEWVGTAGFTALAVWYAVGIGRHHPDWVVTVSGPMIAIALLFLLNWLKHDQLRGNREHLPR